MKEPTIIELQPNDTAFILDAEGNLKEFYMPESDGDAIVPHKIVQVMNILLDTKKSTLDLSHDALIDRR